MNRLALGTARLGLSWRRLLRAARIGPGTCLDVGSGGGPWLRADVLLEADPGAADRERPLLLDRPCVLGDLQALPFRDQAFAYSHASHVLEHVEDPARALAELTRVSARGYIELPSRLHETLSPREDHRWSVRLVAGELCFEPPPPGDDELRAWFREAFDTSALLRELYWSRYFRDFAVALEWTRPPRHRVSSPTPAPRPRDAQDLTRLESQLVAAQRQGRRPRAWLKRTLGRVLGARRCELMPLLACPGCRSALEPGPRELRCSACAHEYPLVAGVPVLYPPARRSP